MPKPLSYEALFAALAVVGTAACSKAAPAPAAQAEPAAAAPAASAPPATATAAADLGAAPSAAPPAATPVLANEPSKGVKANAVEGTETKKPAAPRAKPKGNAACGAGTCSDEMKK